MAKLTVKEARRELRRYASAKKARDLKRFFKTGPGGYAEGDIFIGVTVPSIRKVASRFDSLALEDVFKLVQSKIHEERLLGLLILISRFAQGDEIIRKQIFSGYLERTSYVNNWDLVDLSAPNIVGSFLKDKSRNMLYDLARSELLWERRIGVLATFAFIRGGDFADTLKISELLLSDEHDLIHKATGWMLREVGKRDTRPLKRFLKKFYKKMPRTMLRYAIERFPVNIRKSYLLGLIGA